MAFVARAAATFSASRAARATRSTPGLKRRGLLVNIGTEKRTIVIEPIVLPVPEREPEPAPPEPEYDAPEPEREPEKVPA
jgi:hypothetical protein